MPQTTKTSNLMLGKRGLIMGVANDHSIAWGISVALAAAGAELAFTYQSDSLAKRVEPLAKTVGSKLVLPCDVENVTSVDSLFQNLQSQWSTIDFVVHAIAFSAKDELQGRYADTSRDNFVRTMLISCFSFTEIAKRAADLMRDGGSMLTLTYGASTRVMPNYNIMGVAKAALEASVRYLAADFGSNNIRVNALSSGSMRTLAGSGIAGARAMLKHEHNNALLPGGLSLADVGGTALYLLSDLASGVTGEIVFVDKGYSVRHMPRIEELQNDI